MLLAAVLQAAALAALLALTPRLPGARWASRAPAASLLLWQALGLAGGLLVLEVAATTALAPAGPDHLAALRALPRPLPWWAWLAAALGAAVLGRLVWVLTRSTVGTVRLRRRHRRLVDLVATRNPLLREMSVVDHALPIAYCLPGLRPRVVVSRGVLTALEEDELRAVLDHELAHVVQRHDLVVLPFVALRSTFPRLRAVCCAVDEVALLVEMLADDRAVRRHDPYALARALGKVSGGPAPAGGLGAGASGVLLRAARLVDPPAPLGAPGRCAVLLAALGVLLLPVAGVLLPLA